MFADELDSIGLRNEKYHDTLAILRSGANSGYLDRYASKLLLLWPT